MEIRVNYEKNLSETAISTIIDISKMVGNVADESVDTEKYRAVLERIQNGETVEKTVQDKGFSMTMTEGDIVINIDDDVVIDALELSKAVTKSAMPLVTALKPVLTFARTMKEEVESLCRAFATKWSYQNNDMKYAPIIGDAFFKAVGLARLDPAGNRRLVYFHTHCSTEGMHEYLFNNCEEEMKSFPESDFRLSHDQAMAWYETMTK